MVRASIDTHIFNELVKKVRIGKTGEAYLLDTKGLFQTERRSGGILMQPDPDHMKYPSFHTGIRTFILENKKKEKYLCATTWLKDKKWLLVRQEKADFKEKGELKESEDLAEIEDSIRQIEL